MPTTISSTGAFPLNANDGEVTRLASWTLNDFDNLSVPVGATISGIELLIDMAGGGLNNGGAYFKVNNGTSDSSTKAANENFTNYPTFSDMTVGASDDLWGLEWTPTTANEITSKWNVTFDLGGSTAYFDHVQVRITYSAGGGKIILNEGRLTIKSGKVTL
tara:strand:+ start:2296 stop:2778 length:483 start_codon:yes stop_codon:yes gene_type:complete